MKSSSKNSKGNGLRRKRLDGCSGKGAGEQGEKPSGGVAGGLGGKQQ